MKRILLYIILCFVIIVGLLLILKTRYTLTKENQLQIIGFSILISSIIVVFSQIRINLRFNKRKAALDFSFNQIQKDLFPILKDLKKSIGKDFLVFTRQDSILELLKKEPQTYDDSKKIRNLVLDVLNFYERMSIGVLKDTYDEDICYDDHGFNFIQFYNWTKPFLDELRSKHNEQRLYVNFEHIAEKWQTQYLKDKDKNDRLAAKTHKLQTIRDKKI